MQLWFYERHFAVIIPAYKWSRDNVHSLRLSTREYIGIAKINNTQKEAKTRKYHGSYKIRI